MRRPWLAIEVECYAGYRGEEEPRALRFAGRRVEVMEVVDRWLAPDHRYFRLKGEDSAEYVVRYDTGSDRWELTAYRS